MSKRLNKRLSKMMSVVLAVAMLVTGLPADLLGGIASVKAAETKQYVYDPTQTTINSDGEAITTDEVGDEDYFKVIGTVKLRNTTKVADNPDFKFPAPAKHGAELDKKSGGKIEFTVSGTATVVVEANSTGGSNHSAFALKKGNACVVATDTDFKNSPSQPYDVGVYHLIGSTAEKLTYELGSGTYTIESPAYGDDKTEGNPSSRGVRIMKITVTETPGEGGGNTGGDSGNTGGGNTDVKFDFDDEVIDGVKTSGTVKFKSGTGDGEDVEIEAKNVSVKASALEASSNPAIEEAAKEVAEEMMAKASNPDDQAIISYYDFSLVSKDDDQEKPLQLSSGAIKIKLPYPEGSKKTSMIYVLHKTDSLGEIPSSDKEDDGFWITARSFSPYTVIVQPTPVLQAGQIELKDFAGYEEGAYATWTAVDDADGYRAFVAPAGTDNYTRIDNELIREYPDDLWRVDTVGLAAGEYTIKIEAGKVVETNGKKDLDPDQILATGVTGTLKVTNYDRSGFAFSSNSDFGTGSGAYNDDGTLRAGAQVVYVTPATAKTCTAWVHTKGANKDPELITGFQSILDAKQKHLDAAMDAIDFRIIGCINKADLDHISSSSEGLQIKGKSTYAGMNVTIEGIGEDATVKGFGFLIRNCGNVELRNFAIMDFMDDGVSIDTANCNIWVHNLDIFYGGPGGDSDQAKGDGSVDIKGKSTNITVSYNHFWDSGKCSLCGMTGDKAAEFLVTYHHNWFDHSDSRHPRIRKGSIHIYNNYFDGNAKYGVGMALESNAFVEANYFRNTKYPMLSSLQGTDLLVVKPQNGKGIFSGETGGMIKAFNNKIEGAESLMYANVTTGEYRSDGINFDAYLASTRNEKVPDQYVAVSTGMKYNNFDTNSGYDLGVDEKDIDDPNDVKDIVTREAGRLNGGDFHFTFDDSEDKNDKIITELKSKVVNYESSVVSFGGIDGVSRENSPSTATGVSAPTASVKSGEVAVNTQVELKTTTSGATIYYTTDGKTTPTASSTVYTAPIVITEDTVIKAIAIKDNERSSVVTFAYTVPFVEEEGAVKAPSANKVAGAVSKGTAIILTNNEDGATVYYTLDGTDPKTTGSSSVQSFTGASQEIATINEDTVIKAAAQKDGEWSRVITLAYTVAGTGSSSGGAGGYVHNFSISGTTSSFYTISGNMNSSKDLPSVSYNGLTLTKALKMETATEIKFTSTSTGTLTLVHETTFAKATIVDGTKYTAEKGIITINDLPAGNHTIKKGDVANLYYIAFVPDNYVEEPDTLQPPYADVESGLIEKGTEVNLDCDTDDAKIYYTLDGSNPKTSTATEYKSSLIINEDTILKAYSVKDGEESYVVTYEYIVYDEDDELQYVETVKAEPGAGKVTAGTKIKLTTATQGAEIYYTTDGSTPSSKNDSTFHYYEGAIVINQKTTIKAYAKKAGYVDSAVATFEYTVDGGDTPATKTYEFNPQQIANENGWTENHIVAAGNTEKYGRDDYFTVVGGGNVTFQTTDSNGNTFEDIAPDNNKYNWRFKFGGKSGSSDRKIQFTNTGTAKVTVCAYIGESNVGENPARTINFDDRSDVLTAEPTEYVYENVEAGTHNIRADEKDYFILYVVVEEEPSEDDDGTKEPYDAGITADPAPTAQAVTKGTKVALSWKNSSDKLYYTTDDTDPRTEGSHRKQYTTPITLSATTTIRAAAQNTYGEYSKVVVFKYIVESSSSGGSGNTGGNTGSGDSWTVEMEDSSYDYTGSALKPAFTVYGYDGAVLVEGDDYTVKYSNNVNASVNVTNEKKLPTVTITGKGNLTGKQTVNFEILPADISKVTNGDIYIETGKKVSVPVLSYNGVKLSAKDYKFKNETDKKKTDFQDGDYLELEGQGNFTGDLLIPIHVVAKGELKNTVKKFKVTVDNAKVKGLIYTGNDLSNDIINCFEVVPSKGSDDMTGKYEIVLPGEVTEAGTVKVMVVGLDDYSGCTVSKSVKIQPRTLTVSDVTVTGEEATTYTSTGAVLSDLAVAWNSEDLTNGKDYKLTYSANKKVGTAKYTIAFKGNFKGKVTGTFDVVHAVLEDGIEGIEIVVPDKVAKDNAACKSAPYVTINGVLVKASEYEVTYSVGDENGTYEKSPKVSFSGEAYKTVYVKVKAKGKNYKTTEGSELTGEYIVWNKSTDKLDLSKAKVTFYEDEAYTKKLTKLEYTGDEVRPPYVMVTIGKDGVNYADKCEILYVNNVNKGKATVVVKPAAGSELTEDGLVGSKVASFSITAKNAGGLNTTSLASLIQSLFN